MTTEPGNTPNSPVCFMHIGKVGGHSISQELLSRFDLSEAVNASPEQFDNFTPETFAGKRLVIGHYAYNHTLLLPPSRFLFSIVREPVDRVLSNYWFLRAHADVEDTRAQQMIDLARRWPIEEFVRIDDPAVRQVADNHQTCFFAHDWRHSDPVTEQDFSLAIAHLDDFDLIGVHAAYDDSMQMLCTMLDWLPWPSDNRFNTTASRVATDALSPSVRRQLEELNRFDVALYQEVHRRFCAKRSNLLRTMARQAWRKRREADGKAPETALPTAVELHGSQTVEGDNWHVRQIQNGSYSRWLGPATETRLFTAVAASPCYDVEIHLVGWIDRETLDSLTVAMTGWDCKETGYHVSMEDMRAVKRWRLRATDIAKAGPLLELDINALRTGRLSDHGVESTHDLIASVAVSCVKISAVSEAEATALASGQDQTSATVSDDIIAKGVSLLHGAAGKVYKIVAAERLFRSAVEDDPESVTAHVWLGEALCYQGRSPEAVGIFETALALEKGSATVQLDERTRAHLLERLGEGLILAEMRLDDARAYLTESVRLAPVTEAESHRLNGAAYMLDGLTRLDSSAPKRKIARWPVQNAAFQDLDEVARQFADNTKAAGTRPIGRDTRVVTLGSCFAGNIAIALKDRGVETTALGLGELINSTFANRALIEWVNNDPLDRYSPETIETLKVYFGASPDTLRATLTSANTIIYTLGVAPGFFDKRTGLFHLTQAGKNTLHLLKTNDFRTTTVEENADNIEAVIAGLRRCNPNINIVFTVSPVPLYSTFEYDSAIIADCVSKSVLRAAIDVVLKRAHAGVNYWPAFEMVRWVGAYHPNLFGEEDGTTRHVSERAVSAIVNGFIHAFGDEALKQ